MSDPANCRFRLFFGLTKEIRKNLLRDKIRGRIS